MTRMTDLVKVQSDFRPSVVLPGDFSDEALNQYFVSNYIPTEETLDVFMMLRESLQPGSEHRAHLFHGTYGTGKSDFMLMIANYLTRDPNEPLLLPFFEKLHHLNSAKADAIRQARQGKPPFLLILLQADTVFTFSSFILDGLARTLEKEKLAHLMVKTNYRAAIEQIQKWRSNHASGSYHTLERILEQEHGTTLDGLERDLGSSRGDYAFSIFCNAVEKMTDLPFHPRDVVQRPADAFDEVVKQLDANKYSGIYIICDEFSSLLKQLADSPTAADSKAIDNLAERAIRSKSQQIHFTVVSLFPFTSTQGTTQLAQQSLERSGGRFSQRPLRSLNMEELIKHSITKLRPPAEIFRNVPSQFDDLLAFTMLLWKRKEERRRDREWLRETIVYGAFPLHPLATYCLSRLNSSLAQNERTMFGFLRDEEHGLARFIRESTVDSSNTGYIPIMPLADLFEYFKPNLDEKKADLILIYDRARTSLGSELLAKDSHLMDNILRVLVLLDVVGDPNLSADRTLIRHAVGLPQSAEKLVDSALEQLEQAYVVYKDHAEHYRLFLGQVNSLEMKRQIELRALHIEASPAEKLNSLYPLDAIKADAYNKDRGTARELAARFITLNNLGNPEALNTILQNEDGLVLYTLASSEQDLNAARVEALKATRANDRLVVAIPRHSADLILCFLRKLALENLRNDPEYQSTDAQDLLRDTGQIGKDYITDFQRAYQAFHQPHKFEWYYQGRTENVRFSTDEIATAVMKEIFPKTPPHNASQHLKNGPSRHVQDAADYLLQAPFQLSPPAKGKKPPRDMILREGAKDLGFITQVGKTNGYDEFKVIVPTRSYPLSQEIWELMQNTLKKGDLWQSVVYTLKLRPYGLYSSVLQLFFAAFYRWNREDLEVCEANKMERRPIDVTGSIVEQMVRSPEKYTVIYQPLNEMQRRFLRGLTDRALYSKKWSDAQNTAKTALKRRAAEALLTWGKQVPAIIRQATPDDLATVLTDQPANALLAVTILVRTSQETDAATIAPILLEELPRQLGLPPENGSWEESQMEQALALLESVCSALQPQSFFQRFSHHMAQHIRLIFGLEIPQISQDDLLAAILSWRNQTVGKVTIHMLTSRDARDLISVLDNLDKDESFEEVFLNALPHRFGIQAYKCWNAMSTKNSYLQRLQEAKTLVESVVPTIDEHPTSAPPDDITIDQSKQIAATPITQNEGHVVREEKAYTSIGTHTNSVASVPEKHAVTSTSSKPATDGENLGTIVASPSVATPNPTTLEKPFSQSSSPNGTNTTKPGGPSSAIEQAFTQVQKIFNSLILAERKELLQKLQREYGEQ